MTKKEIQERYRQKNKEKIKAYYKEYYQKNKERLDKQNREYVKNNREVATKRILAYRGRKAKELKEQGQIYTYLSKGIREEKMIKSIAKKLCISEKDAKKMLIDNNWNYVKIVEESNEIATKA